MFKPQWPDEALRAIRPTTGPSASRLYRRPSYPQKNRSSASETNHVDNLWIFLLAAARLFLNFML